MTSLFAVLLAVETIVVAVAAAVAELPADGVGVVVEPSREVTAAVADQRRLVTHV